MAFDLSNNSNWKQIFIKSASVEYLPDGSGRYYMFDDLPIATGSNVLYARLDSSTAKPHWFLGGWARLTDFRELPNYPANSIANNSARKPCGLGVFTLLIFPNFQASEYTVSFQFPYWLRDYTIRVWEYIGEDPNFATSQQNEIINGGEF